MYDYSVESAKHGKYYLKGEKYNKKNIRKADTIIDFKLMGPPLSYEVIKSTYNLEDTLDYKFGHKNISPKSEEEWNGYLKDVVDFYDAIIANTQNDKIHISSVAPIPLLISLGDLMQNDSSNIKIYQYNENEYKWVLDECDDNIKIEEKYVEKDSDILAVVLEINSKVKYADINQVLDIDYSMLSFKLDKPRIGYLNYRPDVLRLKK